MEQEPRDFERRRRDWIFPTILAAAFAASRGLVFALGVRSSEELPQMHVLDRDLLAGDLARSLFFLHTQPPLFNGLIGLILKMAGSHFALAVSCLYWLFGLALSMLMYRLLLRLHVAPTSAMVATLLFILGPACLLYETFTLYDYPVAVLLLAASFFAHRYWTSGRRRDAWLAALLIAAVALTRSLFHLVWVVAAVALVILLRRPPRKAVAALLAPVLIVGLLYVKNAVVFGMFGSSSLLGLNLYRISTELLPREERLQLAESGVLSLFSLYGVNHPIDQYPTNLGEVRHLGFSSPTDRALLPWGWWKKAERSSDGRFVWSIGPQSVLVLPSAGTGPLTLTLHCAPFGYPGASQQTIEVRANGRSLELLRLSPGVAGYRVEIPATVLRKPWNLVSFQYGYSVSPKQVGLGEDSRELAVRWLAIDVEPPVAGPPGVPTTSRLSSPPGDVPALSRVMRRDGGPNLNHVLFPGVMREYQRDAWVTIRRFPGLYAKAVARAGLIFLAPPMEHPAFRVKRRAIALWDRLYSQLFYGALDAHWPGEHSHESRWLPTRELLGRVSWIFVGLALLVLPAAAVRALRDPRDPANATTLFCLFTIIFVAIFGNLLEYGENNRFRMMIDPLFWVVVVAWGENWFRRRLRREASAP
jgi:hypothetical protein